MAKKEEKTEEQFIYKKDAELSKDGFSIFEMAQNVAVELKKKYPEPGHRVRTRLRTRTGTWDVVVKVRTAAKAEAPKAAPQPVGAQ